MTPRSFLGFAVVTGVAVLGAVGSLIAERNATAVVKPAEPLLFPQLQQRLADVARIKVEAPDYQLVLERKGNDWQVANKGNYPARAGSVTRLVGDIAGMRPNEAKTTNPALYARVSVEDPGKPEAKSKLVTIESTRNETLAKFIMGIRSASMGFSPMGGIFIRRPGEAQTWLAEGTPIIPDSIGEWFDQIVHVPGTKIKRITITEGGAVVYEAAKSEEDAIRYALIKVDPKYKAADQEKVANDTAVKRMPLGIISVTFDDVRGLNEVNFPADARTVEFETDEGLILDVTLGKVGDETWVRYKASAPSGNAEAVTQAKDITDKTANWAFKLPSHKTGALNVKIEDLLEDPPPPEPDQPQGFQMPPGFQLPPGMQLPPGAFQIPGQGPGGLPQGTMQNGIPMPPGFQLPPQGGPRQ